MNERIPPIRFSSQNLQFIFFFHSRRMLWHRKDFAAVTEADEREADEALDLAITEPAGFA